MKIKELLKEGESSIDPKVLKNIARMTDNNNHGGAIVAGCLMLGLDDLAKEAKKICREHENTGYLTMELSTKRHKVYQQMMDHAKKTLSDADYKKFYGSY